MRIVIDLQASQSTTSRHRGMGRYSLSLARAMVRHRGEHDVFIALNGLFPETIEPIRAAFHGLLPQERILVWHSVPPVSALDRGNDWRRRAAELVREAFLAGLNPDVVHVSSLFEGLTDDAVTSIGAFCTLPTAVTVYDLIPLVHRRLYLDDPEVEAWYLGKLGQLRRADLWLAISESSRREALAHLGLPDHRVVNVSTAADPHFRRARPADDAARALERTPALQRPFVMYTGGFDPRKNLEALIRAYARLPRALRGAHQLAIVGPAQPHDTQRLSKLAAEHGLSPDEVVFVGFVADDDLVALYSRCRLFVFPSWHEGFGLPALEAMCCGAPVIGASATSVPEVIGLDRALFDPHSDDAITAAMERALSDEAFRDELVRNAETQAARFSWDESARRTLAAFERFRVERDSPADVKSPPLRRPTLACVSPLPPTPGGVADYAAALLPELARHYEIEVIDPRAAGGAARAKSPWPVRTPKWFARHGARYDRVLYHVGDSDLHGHVFDLLPAFPGVVVLHDFQLSGRSARGDGRGTRHVRWAREAYHSHGYPALRARFHARDADDADLEYPCNLAVLQDSLGVIVHSEHCRQLAEEWYGGAESADWAVIPPPRRLVPAPDALQAKAALGLRADDFLVCSFGAVGPRASSHRLLRAWLGSRLHADPRCHLVFVGDDPADDHGGRLHAAILAAAADARVRVSGRADPDTVRGYLAAADLGVQLCAHSRGETPVAVLDCMSNGIAAIVNASGGLAELPDGAVARLPDVFSDEQLIDALEALWLDPVRRRSVGETARAFIRDIHDPGRCADLYAAAIERQYRSAAAGVHALASAVADLAPVPGDADLVDLAEAIARTTPAKFGARQLLVDVSALAQGDAGSGIQRVVRSILQEWLARPPDGFRVEPVLLAAESDGYRYARRFTLGLLACPRGILDDDLVEFSSGDVFLGLDLQPAFGARQRAIHQDMRNRGVSVKFVVYDLLPVLRPEGFRREFVKVFTEWLEAVAQSDGAICISRSVAGELGEWLQHHPARRHRPFTIDWFHLGADLETPSPGRALPDDAGRVLAALHARASFVSVGTIEPRKGHAQMLAAFESLWGAGNDLNLVLVGRQGWMMEAFVATLRGHRELGQRLFWLEGISDEYLGRISAACTCLLAASEGEGFGLPLVEAAGRGLPIIARDIPVFREVAGEHAFYFHGLDPQSLAAAIVEWLELHRRGRAPRSDDLPRLTWKESADQLARALLPGP